MAPPPPLPSPSGSWSTIAGAVFEVQMLLLEHDGSSPSLSDRHLLAAASLLSLSDYSDVVTERTIASLCGFPLCPNTLPPERGHRGRYHISLSEHRVYDLEERSKFCSEQCLVRSRAYEASLSDERPSSLDLSKAKLEELFRLFHSSSSSDNDNDAAKAKAIGSSLNFNNDSSNRKDVVPIEDWVGPPDAIEGYVPKSKPNTKIKSHPDSGFQIIAPDMDFKSEIFFGDDSYDLSSSKTEHISELISNKLESISLHDNSNNKAKKGKKPSSLPKSKPDQNLASSEQKSSKRASGEGHSKQNGLNFKSSLKKEGSGPSNQKQSVRWVDKEQSYANENSNKSDMLLEEDAAMRSLRVASAEACAEALIHAADTVSSGNSEVEDAAMRSLRVASAEACAEALIHAADTVSSGNSEVEDAVLEAGIVILPQQSYETEKEPQENREGDMQEIERDVVKWPQKPVLLETDVFEVDDSWHDTPPEGFSLDLSPFCTMWMAIFGWVTRSTLCYVYGQEESLSEEFSEVEGREYPQRVVLNDGQSAEIRKALEGFVCRALPSLVLDLRIPVPVSTLEKFLGQLMDTMTFAEALPALRMRQWHVVVLLFLDALSVHHLPSLSSIMANRSLILQKVLNGAQLEAAHYDSMIDVFIPLGRCTSLSFKKNCE